MLCKYYEYLSHAIIRKTILLSSHRFPSQAIAKLYYHTLKTIVYVLSPEEYNNRGLL